MPTDTTTAGQLPAVDEPKHPLSQLTTYELDAYLRQLERAVAFFEPTNSPVLSVLRDRLAQARAEHDDRRRIRAAR